MAKRLITLNILISALILCGAVYGDDNETRDIIAPGGGEVIVHTIKGTAKEVISNLFNLLKDRGYFITSYYPSEGTISASKDIETSQLLLQAKNISDNEAYRFVFSIPRRISEGRQKKIIVSSKAKQLNGSSRLTLILRQGYTDWGKFKDTPITKDSAEYQEIVKILDMLKVVVKAGASHEAEVGYKSND